MFVSDKGNWLKNLAKEDVWANSLETVPSTIVFVYTQLKELADDGQVYGVILILKDIYELLLKTPLVMSLILINSKEDCKGTPEYIDTVKAVLALPMSMGLWEVLAQTIQRSKTFNLPMELLEIIKRTRYLYVQDITDDYPDIVCWRNGTIGHGALKFEDDPTYQEEIRVLISRLKEYFEGKKKYSITGLYEKIFFTSYNTKLTGTNYIFSSEPKDVLLHIDNQVYSVDQFINNSDYRFFVFNSYSGRKGVTHLRSSFDGKDKSSFNQFFNILYRRYVSADSNNFDLVSKYIKREEDMLLECLNTPLDYIKPNNLVDKIEELLEGQRNGIISIHMERGTGKSSFSNHMNGLYHNKPIINNSFSRCYHITNAGLRGVHDFINTINYSFRHSYNPKLDLVGSLDEMLSLTFNTNTPAEDMARFLNYYHNIYRKDYTILVIDGIDEITEQTKDILDFIPRKSQL